MRRLGLSIGFVALCSMEINDPSRVYYRFILAFNSVLRRARTATSHLYIAIMLRIIAHIHTLARRASRSVSYVGAWAQRGSLSLSDFSDVPTEKPNVYLALFLDHHDARRSVTSNIQSPTRYLSYAARSISPGPPSSPRRTVATTRRAGAARLLCA